MMQSQMPFTHGHRILSLAFMFPQYMQCCASLFTAVHLLQAWVGTCEVAERSSGAPAQHGIAWIYCLAQPDQRRQNGLVRARRRCITGS